MPYDKAVKGGASSTQFDTMIKCGNVFTVAVDTVIKGGSTFSDLDMTAKRKISKRQKIREIVRRMRRNYNDNLSLSEIDFTPMSRKTVQDRFTAIRDYLNSADGSVDRPVQIQNNFSNSQGNSVNRYGSLYDEFDYVNWVDVLRGNDVRVLTQAEIELHKAAVKEFLKKDNSNRGEVPVDYYSIRVIMRMPTLDEVNSIFRQFRIDPFTRKQLEEFLHGRRGMALPNGIVYVDYDANYDPNINQSSEGIKYEKIPDVIIRVGGPYVMALVAHEVEHMYHYFSGRYGSPGDAFKRLVFEAAMYGGEAYKMKDCLECAAQEIENEANTLVNYGWRPSMVWHQPPPYQTTEAYLNFMRNRMP